MEKIQIWLVALFGSLLLRFISWSCRWRFVGDREGIESFSKHKEPIIFAFWHDRQLLCYRFLKLLGRLPGHRGLCMLSSRHRDGRFASAVMVRLKLDKSIVGSSSHGGRTALRELIRKIRDEGKDVAMTPDGPTGPRHVLKDGVIKLAQVTGAVIVPLAYDSSSKWVFRKSWDKMMLPKPFSSIVAGVSKPIVVPRDMTEQDFVSKVAELQRALASLTTQVESEVSNATVL